MSVLITGQADLDMALKMFLVNTEKAIDDAVRITAIKVQKSAIKSIREPSMGTYVTRYTASGKPYSHVAAKEGETPNNDTGRLIGSIALDHHKGKQVAYVGTNVDYGFFLETVMNRPWLQPAKDREVVFFKDNVTKAVQMQIRKA
tara:strand:+ start:296 stop:730 length:435 start_codon:yes stop_codon:yes gene_type:complete